jgi:hypothetical protein
VGGAIGYSDITPATGVAFWIYSNPARGTGYAPTAVPNGTYRDTSPVSLISGHPIAVTLTYDGTTLTELLIDTVTINVFVTSYKVDLPGTVGGATAYVGFTGATGAAASDQRISNFSFTSSYRPPFAASQQPNGITTTSAVLNGMGTANGSPAIAWFEWGTNGVFDQATTPVPIGSGFSVVAMKTNITGLLSGNVYNSRLAVSNYAGVVRGAPRRFILGGTVTAWAGDIGNATNVPAGLANVTAIAAGDGNSIALKTDGTVVEWGVANDPPPGLTNIVGISAGVSHFLALRSNGTVVAWGNHTFGEDFGQTNVPAGLSNVISVVAGNYHSLALKKDGTVVSWGTSNETNMPPGLSNVVLLATGGAYHSLALKNDGTVVGWGSTSAALTNAPGNLTNAVDLAAGVYASFALKSDGRVVAWAGLNDGQTNVPPGLSNVISLAAGWYHGMAVRSNGTVVAWGRNDNGQTNVPAGLSNVVALAAGGLHNLALRPTPPPPLQIVCPPFESVDSFADVPPVDPNSVQVISGCPVVSRFLLQEGRQTNGCETTILRTYVVIDSCNQTNICTQEIEVRIPPKILGFTTSQMTKPDGIHIIFCATVAGADLGSFNWSVNNGNPIGSSAFGNCFEVVMDPLNEDDVSVNMTVNNPCGSDGGNSPPVTTCGICLSRGTPGLLTSTTGSGSSPPVPTLNCGQLSSNALWFRVLATNGTGLATVSTEGSSNNTLIAIYTGPLNSPSPLACNDDVSSSNRQSRVTFNVVQGTVYWIAIDPRTNAPSSLRIATGFEPRIESYGFKPDGSFQLQSGVAPPIPYSLLMATNLSTNATWQVVLKTNLGTNFPYLYYRDTNISSSARKFYRLGAVP